MAVYAVAFLVYALVPASTDPDTAAFIGDAVFLPLGGIVALFAWRASLALGISTEARRAWRWLALAYVAFWIGDVSYFWLEIVAREVPSPSLADAAYLAYYPLLLIGLLSFPRVIRTGADRLRFVLDATTVALGGAMVVWYFLLAPIATAESSDLLETALGAAYPVGDLVLLLGFAAIAIRAPRDLPRRSVALLLAGLIVSLVADIGYGVQSLDGTFEPGRWVDGLYVAAWALLGLSAELGAPDRRRLRVAGRSAAREEDIRQSVPILPYFAVALGYAMLLLAVQGSVDTRGAGLILGAGVLTALVIVRQAAVVRENMRLLREAEARRSEARFRSLVQNSSDVIVVMDAEGTIRYATPSVERVLGHTRDAVHGRRLATLLHPEDRATFGAQIRGAIDGVALAGSRELRVPGRDGSPIFVEVSVANLLADPEIHGLVVTIRDVDDRKRLEVELTRQAFHDALTGLANRPRFEEGTTNALEGTRAGFGPTVIVFIDIDNFKTVNDSLGHEAGDAVLLEFARRIRAATRGGDLTARFGGDEFAVLLAPPSGRAHAAAVSERILAALAAPHALPEAEIVLNASIGIAMSEAGEESVTELLRNADVAMYAAKAAGKGQYRVFEREMQEPLRRRLDLGSALRRALAQDQFEVHYQPIVELATGRLVGAEALLRWRRDHGVLVPPAEFIPLAEELGLINEIGDRVLRASCAAAVRWPHRDGRAPRVSVNLSARQLLDPGLVERVAGTLASSGLAPERLVLEVTESQVIAEPLASIPRLHELKALGLRLAVDDFGTGYSSLSYLRRLPVDEVKIDRAFVADLANPVGAGLVNGIVQLGRALGLTVVAEGIETADELAALRSFQCDFGQGFLFHPAVDAATIHELLGAAGPERQHPAAVAARRRATGGAIGAVAGP